VNPSSLPVPLAHILPVAAWLLGGCHTAVRSALACLVEAFKDEFSRRTLRVVSNRIGKALISVGKALVSLKGSQEWDDDPIPAHGEVSPPQRPVGSVPETRDESGSPDRIGNDDPFDPRPGPRPWRMTPPFVRKAS